MVMEEADHERQAMLAEIEAAYRKATAAGYRNSTSIQSVSNRSGAPPPPF